MKFKSEKIGLRLSKNFTMKVKRIRGIIQCVPLGLSSLEIHKGLTESLTGGIQLTQFFHWNYAESKEAR